MLIEIRHDDSWLAAIRLRHFRPVHHGQARAKDVLAEVVEPRGWKRAAGLAELDDGNVRGPEPQHQRRCNVWRHVLEYDQRAGLELRDRAADISALVEKHLLYADAGVARRLDARDVIDERGHLALVKRQDAILDIMCAHAVEGPHHADDGDVDLGIDIERHASGRADSEQGEENEEGRDGVRRPQGKADELHAVWAFSAWGRGSVVFCFW